MGRSIAVAMLALLLSAPLHAAASPAAQGAPALRAAQDDGDRRERRRGRRPEAETPRERAAEDASRSREHPARSDDLPRRPRQRDAGSAAVEAQRANGGGRVLAVERGDRGHRVKLLKDGEVRVIYVPDPE